MTRVTLTIALAVMSCAVLRAEQTRDDFAFGFTVEPLRADPMWEITLPDEVYRTVTRPNLEDLRVFDRQGRVVPHVIRRPTALPIDRPTPRRLPFFPLRGRVDEPASSRSLHIVTNNRGEIVSARTEEPSLTAVERVVAYLIDTRGLTEMPDRLELEWKGGIEKGFAVTVDVQASDDLAHWRMAVDNVTLVDLRSTNAALVRREIDLPTQKANYLRIEWPDSLRDVQLFRVQAFFPAKQQLPARLALRVLGVRAGDSQNAYEFDTNGFRPADRARLQFRDQRNAVIEAVLLSRNSLDESWRWRHSAIFYSLESHGTKIQDDPVTFQSTSDRFWRAEIAGAGVENVSGNVPTLELGWVPDLLTVIAQGQGPYTVAFGSARVHMPDHSSDALLRVIDDQQKRGAIVSGQRSEILTLGGRSKLERPFPWKTWILWTVLVAGVCLLAWMVSQLSRRIEVSGPGSG